MEPFRFEILHQSKRSLARVGRIHTPHGIIDTPNFVAVGTNAVIKALPSHSVEELGLQLMFCNTYHLLLQPGTAVIEKAGGLHTFMNRSLPLITDSGGFQVFSLTYGSVHEELKSGGKKKEGRLVLNINEEGVLFRSYRDGSTFVLTPESSVTAQKQLGADIIIPFDELPGYHTSCDELKRSFDRTHRWEKRSLQAHRTFVNNQAMYGVVHGGVDLQLRKESCSMLRDLEFDGYAIGGSVGKTTQELYQVVQCSVNHLPVQTPKHVLGIGDIASLEALVPLGVDTFDSSYPTKAARHGWLLTEEGRIKIEHQRYKEQFAPVDQNCSCSTCQRYTAAYLHHLFKAKEITALILATTHNLHMMLQKMKRIREAILEDRI